MIQSHVTVEEATELVPILMVTMTLPMDQLVRLLNSDLVTSPASSLVSFS